MLEPNELTMEIFNNGIKDGVVMVDFNAPWCGPCRALQPVVHELKQEYAEKAKILEVNIDEAPRGCHAHGHPEHSNHCGL